MITLNRTGQEVYDKLRPYQQEAIRIMNSRPRALHYDDMGLGKTVTTLTSLEMSLDFTKPRNILIICPVNALYVWKGEIQKWFGKEAMVYHGYAYKRKKKWQEFLDNPECSYLVTTYGMFEEVMRNTKESSHHERFGHASYGNPSIWDALVADEIHVSGLLNHKSKTFGIIEPVTRTIPWVRLLTGTPIRQGVTDAFAPLQIMDKTVFKSYWQFVNKYCITFDTPFGKEIDRKPKDVGQFRNTMQRYMIRRMKGEVLDDLPGKQRQPILCDLTPKQLKAYKELMEQMFTIDGDNIVIVPNALTLKMRLRQLLVCPMLVGIDDRGAALNTLVEMGMDLLQNNKPFVVFTPFKKVLPFIKEALLEKNPSLSIHEIHGQMTDVSFATQWQTFQDSKNKNKVLLCVIKSGASFQATEAATGFFLGYEWDFNLNSQAEDRLCRLGQKDFVNIYYLMHRGTVDEDVAAKLNDKKEASDWIIGNDEQFRMLLEHYGALGEVD